MQRSAPGRIYPTIRPASFAQRPHSTPHADLYCIVHFPRLSRSIALDMLDRTLLSS